MIDLNAIGSVLGSGSYRDTFEYDADSVVKKEKWESTECNYAEVMKYEDVKMTNSHLLRYLFAVLDTTDDCKYLRMERAVEILGDRFKFEDGRDDYNASIRFLNDTDMGKEVKEIAEALHITDIHAWNIGIRDDGSWGFIDYAD